MTIIWPKAPQWSQDVLVRTLAERLKNRALHAYLIGSYARNTATEESDIDIVLVTETSESWPERASAFEDLREELGSMDIVVYTLEEWQKLYEKPTPYFEHIQSYWVKII